MRRHLALYVTACLFFLPCGSSRGDEFLSEPCGEPSICEEACCERECCDCWSDGDRLLGLLPSDHCFDRFVSPLSNPFFFEDPRSLTEARAIFIDNVLPNDLGNGEIQVWAAQLRGRISDRTSLIAPRLGYLDLKPGGVDGPQGFMSAPVGVKYNFLRDVDRQFLVSGGITYFIPGSKQAYSGYGDGDFHFFLTGGKQIFDFGHWLSATGFRIPCDNNWGTQLWYWSNQWDYEVVRGWYGLAGVNWYHWMSSSTGLTGPITGVDLIDLPGADVAGTNLVSGLVGVKWKPSGNLEVATGYEFPLTQNEDILHNRLYVDFILRY